MRHLFTTRILNIETHTENLKSFELVIPNDIAWDFLPGQYVDIAKTDEPTKFCGFSLTSVPSQKTQFSISVQQTDNPVTKYLFQSSVGDQVIVRGPAGDFVLDYTATPRAILLGGGIGVTPLISMFRTAMNHPHQPIVLFFHSAKTESELLFHREFDETATHNPNLSYYCTVTRQKDWNGTTDRFNTDFLLSKLTQQSLSGFDFYICGPGSMNADFEKSLQAKGIAKNKIHLESYYEP